MIKFHVEEPEGFEEFFAALELDSRSKARTIMEMVGAQTVAFLRSFTDKMQPPVGNKTYRTKKGVRKRYNAAGSLRRNFGLRRAHPGGWADITGALALGYSYEVLDEGDSVVLILSNPVEYAATLEARDGYFVLSGVADPGGPVEQELRRIVAMVAPEWEIVHA